MMVNVIHKYFWKKHCLFNWYVKERYDIQGDGGIGVCETTKPLFIDEK